MVQVVFKMNAREQMTQPMATVSAVANLEGNALGMQPLWRLSVMTFGAQ
jgi:hypothetical protein